MEIAQQHRKQIEEIISRTECPKRFECHRSGFARLGRVKFLAEGKLLECLEDNPGDCAFGVSFKFATFCKCPLRNYIAENLCL